MEVRELENKIAKFLYDLETEDRLVRVGLKDVLETEAVFKKHAGLFTKESLDSIREVLSKAKNKKDKEILSRIYFTVAASFIGNQTAKELDEVKTYFSQAKVKVDGEELAYYQLAPKISKETIFEKRERLDDAAVEVTAKINPKEEKLMMSEISLLGDLGFASYLDYYQKSKGMDYNKFYKVVEKLLKATNMLWFDLAEKTSRQVFKKPFRGMRACHLVYLRAMSMYDNFYPKEKVMDTFVKFTKEIGLDDLLATIKIDDVDRPKKNPRAVCYWPDPPKEVHLVIKPIGGEQDYEAAFHEGGHALHGAAIDLKLPYTFRTLAKSNAMTEAYAFVLEDLVFEPTWLSANLNVSAYSGERICAQANFVNLMMLRRYLGKFSYEYQLFSTKKYKAGPKLYAKNLKDATGFVSHSENWLNDMDGGFYSADYLRAWIAGAQIKDYLKKKFGEKWFASKKAGKFLRELFASGVKYELEEVISDLSYKPFDSSYLIANYKRVLAKSGLF